MSASTGYVSAPATRLLATHCALCGRPLLDAPSVECGMGPHCRAKAMRGAPETHRAEVNALVARIAANTSADTVNADVAAVASYGYAVLAETLVRRLQEGRTVTVETTTEGFAVSAPFSETFNASLRAHVHGRRWDRDAKAWRVPSAAKRGLWTALREAFPGGFVIAGGVVHQIPA